MSDKFRTDALNLLFKTLDVSDVELDINNFYPTLISQIRNLKRYLDIKELVKDIDKNDVTKTVFESLKKMSDDRFPVSDEPGIDKNGVFISSMKHGYFECAGRSALASTILSEFGIESYIVDVPGHSLLIAKFDENTYVYCDFNQDLYFIFPKEAIKKIVDTKTGKIVELVPFAKDFKRDYLGLGPVYHNIVVLFKPEEGVIRQYLHNLSAFLGGADEFNAIEIENRDKLRANVRAFESELCGVRSKEYEDYYQSTPIILPKIHERTDILKEKVYKMLSELEKDGFISSLSELIAGEEAKDLIYMNMATKEDRVRYSELVYQQLKEKGVVRKNSVY